MATTHGKSGLVFLGSNQVAEVTEYSLDEAAEFAEDTNLTDTAKTTHSQAITSWRGTITAWWDDTDTTGQEALTAGASVTLNLRPEGTGSGLYQYSGTARITNITHAVQRGQIQQRTFTFEGSGALSRAAQ